MGILERLDEVGKMLYPDVNYERVSKCIKLPKKMYNERKDNKIRSFLSTKAFSSISYLFCNKHKHLFFNSQQAPLASRSESLLKTSSKNVLYVL